MSTVYGTICFIKNKHKEQTQETNIKKQTQKRHKEQTQGSSVERSHLASWQCKASLSSPNGADHQQPGLETALSSSLQPRLAPSDFYLFGPLKEFTRGTKFESNDEVKSVVSDWLRHQSKDFFMLRECVSLCTDGKNVWNWWENLLKKNFFMSEL